MVSTRELGGVDFEDGFTILQILWIVVRRDPLRFKVCLSAADARANMEDGDELWTRHVYEDISGGISWSNLLRETRE